MIELFWILLALIIYIYVGYGLLITLLGAFQTRYKVIPPCQPLNIHIVIAAHNEANVIAEKLETVLNLDSEDHHIRCIVVTDGCTDNTADVVRGYKDKGIELLEIKEHVGKIHALNRAMIDLNTDIVVFSDANSMLHPTSVMQLVKHFGNSNIGGVCGQLTVPGKQTTWLGSAESIYWAYDNALKNAENRLGGAVSAQGSLYAIRRELVEDNPPAVADDLFTSLRVVTKGQRLIYEPDAVAEETVATDMFKEYGRRVRSSERSLRGVLLMSELLNPFRYGIYSLQLLSHNLLRRISTLFLVAFYPVSLYVMNLGDVYAAVTLAQTFVYGIAGLALLIPPVRKLPGVGIPLYFVLGQAAIGMGVVNMLFGKHSDTWTTAR